MVLINAIYEQIGLREPLAHCGHCGLKTEPLLGLKQPKHKKLS